MDTTWYGVNELRHKGYQLVAADVCTNSEYPSDTRQLFLSYSMHRQAMLIIRRLALHLGRGASTAGRFVALLIRYRQVESFQDRRYSVEVRKKERVRVSYGHSRLKHL